MSDSESCPVCYDSLKTKIYFPLPCHHKICLECNEKIDLRRCPLCRREIPIKLTRKEYILFVLSLFCPPLLVYFMFKK